MAVAAGSAAVAVAATSAVLVVRGRGERWAFRAAIGAAGLVVVAFVSAGGARLVAPH